MNAWNARRALQLRFSDKHCMSSTVTVTKTEVVSKEEWVQEIRRVAMESEYSALSLVILKV